MSSPPAAADPLPVADFLRAVRRSRLVDPGEVDALAADPGASAADLADRLVAAGRLTRFQADKLVRGFWHGLVVGRYRLLCPLGRGGMGIVYLARPADRPGDPVAVKVLTPRRAKAEPRSLARFRREMAVGLALPAHPHLAQLTDAGEDGGVHYLAMRFVPGRTVRQWVGESGPMAVGAAGRAFADAADGLAAAHRAGFVHRDVKPANVMVSPGGRGTLLDFGFALVVGEPPPADPAVVGGRGYAVGTLDYMAPEQAADAAAAGPPADVYALGAALFYALTGQPPFPGGDPADKFRRHRTADPPAVTALNPAVPAGLGGLVGRLLAKNPADRPTADRAAHELAAWADPPPLDDPTATAADPLRAAERRWLAARAAGDDPGGAADPSLSGVTPVAPEDSLVAYLAPVRTADRADPPADPSPWPAARLLAAAAAVSFAVGLLAGRWAR